MADDEQLPDFSNLPSHDPDSDVPTAPADPDDDAEDVRRPMNSA
jgi:hypothetical protein